MHILNQVQVNLIYTTNRNLFLWIEIFICTTDITMQLPADGHATYRIGMFVQRKCFQWGSDGRSFCVQISRERSYPLPIYWYHSKGNWLRNNFAADSFYIMKLCSIVVYCRNCPKYDKFRYLILILAGGSSVPLISERKRTDRPTPIESTCVAHTYLFRRWHDHLSAVAL